MSVQSAEDSALPPTGPQQADAIASGTAPAQLSLRLIATSDLHACLLPYDYCANRAVAGRSLSDVSRQIAAARAEATNSLLFDNGDFLQGSPLADYVANATRRRRPHPVITAFNTLGYDAVTLGNHEFNYGLGFLTASLAHAAFPVVSANIATRLGPSPLRDKTLLPPFAMLKRQVTDTAGRRHILRIGVIGFAPPQIEVWDRDHLGDRIRMRDIIASARAWLPRLRAKGADVIVALAHSGIGPIEPEAGMENAATALAALPEVDAVIAGHCHLAFPGPGILAGPGVDPVLGLLAGKPAVMPGHSGSHVGIIDLMLTRSSRGPRRWIVSSGRAHLGARPGQAIMPAADLRRAIGADHRAVLAWSRTVIGMTRVPLHTHFATTRPSAAVALIAAAKVDHASRALTNSRWDGVPVLAAAAPFRAGGRGGADHFTDIPAGRLRMRHLADLYPYPNTLVALALTGAQVADWLEQSATIFNRIVPGAQDAPLHDPQVPAFAFDMIPGLDYAINLSQPARFDALGRLVNPDARRITGLCLNGSPLALQSQVVLVTNSHRASLFATAQSGLAPEVVLADGTRSQHLLSRYVRTQGQVGEPAPRHWHFLPMPGTTVTIRAGDGALAHLGDLAPFRPVPLGPDAEGFQRFRLHL